MGLLLGGEQPMTCWKCIHKDKQVRDLQKRIEILILTIEDLVSEVNKTRVRLKKYESP